MSFFALHILNISLSFFLHQCTSTTVGNILKPFFFSNDCVLSCVAPFSLFDLMWLSLSPCASLDILHEHGPVFIDEFVDGPGGSSGLSWI